jgi:O-antigen ligase
LKYRTTKILLWANLLIFPPHIFFLQSKIGCLLFGITLLIYIVRALNRNQRRYGLTIFTLVAIMGCAALYIHMAKGNDKQHRLVNSIIKFKNDNPSNPTESSAIRVAIWKNALEINKEHWLCGIGAGDVSNELHNKAIEHQYTYIASGDFNCHNQFLQVWLGLGIVGLLLFIGIFATAFLICARNRNMGGCIIIVIFAFNLFVECMLERYAGATLIPIATVIICSIPPTMLSSGKLASHSREALPSTSCA